jgi:uncharacterized protein (TIGR02271 family)
VRSLHQGGLAWCLHRSNGPSRIGLVLHEKVAQVRKEPVVTEIVRVGRRARQQTEHVEETVRREVADVETEGHVRVED